jgi:glycine/D-amino acid oxidase-like deaminating enzyme
VSDHGAANFSPEDGWLDPNAAVQGFRIKARSLGASYLADRVVGLSTEGNLVRSATLGSGRTVEADHIVNCAGAWAQEICAMLGVPLPVEPMRRFDTHFAYQAKSSRCPTSRISAALAMRPEGSGFTAGLVDWNEPRGFDFEVDHTYFSRVVWPAAAHRIRAFKTLKEGSAWTGLNDQNELDANMILGRVPREIRELHHGDRLFGPRTDACTGCRPCGGRACARRRLPDAGSVPNGISANHRPDPLSGGWYRLSVILQVI